MKRRTVLALGGGVAAIGALTAVGVNVVSPYMPGRPLPTGALRVDKAIDVTFGDFRLVIDGGRFAVTRGTRTVWAVSGPFLLCGTGRLHWTQKRGHFTAKSRLDDLQDTVAVSHALVDGSTVTVHGVASGAGTAEQFVLAMTGDSRGLDLDLHCPGAGFVAFRAELGADEGVHGCGAQFTDFDLRGQALLLVTREQGVGRGTQPLTMLAEVTQGVGGSVTSTYAPMPALVTDSFRGLSWTNDEVAQVDLRTTNRLDVQVWTQRLQARLDLADDPPTLLHQQGLRQGKMQPPPRWTGDGAIVGLQGGTDEVRRKVAALTAQGAAIAGVWLRDWTGQRTTADGQRTWWNWELDEQHYPGWDGLAEELRSRNIRVLSYVNPFLVDAAAKPGGVRRDLFAEAKRAGYLVKNSDGVPYVLDQGGFDAGLVDLTNPDAWHWFRDVIVTQVAATGGGGWMADFGEELPFDAVLRDGTPAVKHNQWPRLWADLNRSAQRRLGDDARLVFHRSSWRGAPSQVGMFWAGDQLTNFDGRDGMLSALLGMLSGGVSGLTLNHADVGGYLGIARDPLQIIRTPELLKRWAEWSVWTPLLRTHEGNLPDLHAQVFDDDVVADFARFTRMYAALADYRQEVLEQAGQDGVPAMRHCWLHYPGTSAAQRDDQYFFGDRFLIAPVFGSIRGRGVTPPPGTWVSAWTRLKYQGGQEVNLPTPPGQPGVLYREGDQKAEAIAERVKLASF